MIISGLVKVHLSIIRPCVLRTVRPCVQLRLLLLPEPPAHRRDIRNLDTDYVMESSKRAGKLDVVVISGGEPMLHRDLLPLIKSIKGLDIR